MTQSSLDGWRGRGQRKGRGELSRSGYSFSTRVRDYAVTEVGRGTHGWWGMRGIEGPTLARMVGRMDGALVQWRLVERLIMGSEWIESKHADTCTRRSVGRLVESSRLAAGGKGPFVKKLTFRA